MECKFVVGQKVVCISKSWMDYVLNEVTMHCPIYGNVYTIKSIQVFDGIMDGIAFLTLKEIGGERVYAYTGFRPLQERPKETDISVFRKMLDDVKEPERV